MRIVNANVYSYFICMQHEPRDPMKTTLTTPPVAPLLERLFADAAKTNQVLGKMFGHLSREERAARMSDPNADYRAFYGKAKDIHMAVAPDTAMLLYMLARGNSARAVVEFGTSFGISTIHLAAALRDNGGGRLIGTEFEPSKLAHARANLQAAGLDDLVEVREGDALETLAHDLPEQIDFVLLDGHKALYAKVLSLVAPRLRTGAYLVADNADACPDYLKLVRAPGSGYLSVPFSEDVELTMKL
jgi:predicted O-methyltransferase YrrM